MSHYTSVQFIGFAVYTGNPPTKSHPYYGLSSDLKDLTTRLNIVKEMISWVVLQSSFAQEPTILKILVFPEFLFRSWHGAYPYDSVMRVFEDLRFFLAQPQFSHCLIVCGTIVAHMPIIEPASGAEILNVAPVILGNSLDPSNSIMVYKEYISHIDFEKDKINIKVDPTSGRVPLPVHPVDGARLLPPSAPLSEMQRSGLGGEGFFQLRNITSELEPIQFALEICKDHLMSRLRRALPRVSVFSQIQLIVACGLSRINPRGIVVGHGGYVFHVDGLNLSINLLHNCGTYQAIELVPVCVLFSHTFRETPDSFLRFKEMYGTALPPRCVFFKPVSIQKAEVVT